MGKMSVEEKEYSRIENMLLSVEEIRQIAKSKLNIKRKAELGQYFTEYSLANFMSEMFNINAQDIKILDAGAGVGSLTASFVAKACKAKTKPEKIFVVAVEIDKNICSYLSQVLDLCKQTCDQMNIHFCSKIIEGDFIDYGTGMIDKMYSSQPVMHPFNFVIMNPPYKHIHSNSKCKNILKNHGIEVVNSYAGFVMLAKRLLSPGGQIVAITPRSFCNGTHFRTFRHDFLEDMKLKQIHVFESRSKLFNGDGVWQENIVFHANKMTNNTEKVIVTWSNSLKEPRKNINLIEYDKIVQPSDPEKFIRIVKDNNDKKILEEASNLEAVLDDLNIKVSTGKVVDFRRKESLRYFPSEKSVPLIYPSNFVDGFIRWPTNSSKKPNFILASSETENILVPKGNYVLVKRITFKESKRRVVAAIYDYNQIDAEKIGFDNHLNFFHCEGKGLPEKIAKGLTIYLNSTFVDRFIRQFNGHTQVNATDLRNLKYPSLRQLETLGSNIIDAFPNQNEIDRLIREVILFK